MAYRIRKFLFSKKKYPAGGRKDDLLDKEQFYQMLLKFQKNTLFLMSKLLCEKYTQRGNNL